MLENDLAYKYEVEGYVEEVTKGRVIFSNFLILILNFIINPQ